MSKFQEDDDEKFQLGHNEQEQRGSEGWRRRCSKEADGTKEGWSQHWNKKDDDGKKESWSQLGVGHKERWSRDDNGSNEGWNQHGNKKVDVNKESWSRQRDRGALGFFLCPVCLATHLVPRLVNQICFPLLPIPFCLIRRSAFSLLPRAPNLPLRPLSLVSLHAPLVHQPYNQFTN